MSLSGGRRVRSVAADARLVIGVVVGMLLAGFLLPLAAREPSATQVAAGGAGRATVPGAAPAGGGGLAGAASDAAASAAGGSAGAPGAGSGGGAAGSLTGGSGSGPAADAGGLGIGAAGTDAGVARTASDQGVTADTVTLGAAVVNLSTLQAAGIGATNGTVAENEKIFQALADDQNAKGGVGGRRILVAARDYDPIDASKPVEACRQLTEDDKVFAAIVDTGTTPTAMLCYARQHGVPAIGFDGTDLPTFAQGGGLLFTVSPSLDKIVYNHVLALHQHGYLAGKTIGLVTLENTTTAFDQTMVPTIEGLGYKVAHRSRLSNDLATAQSQIPIEVAQMRSAGVDLIMFDGGAVYSNLWLNQAQKSAYNPTYSFDWVGGGDDDFGIQTASGKVDGYAWGALRRRERKTDRPAAPSDEECVALAQKAVGHEIKRTDDQYWNSVESCSRFHAFVDALAAAGPNPTRVGFAAAFANLGQRPDVESGPAGVGGSWAPGKPDAGDWQVEMREDMACKCWKPVADWQPMVPVGG